MKRILIYDTAIEGHRLEYIHHIYMAVDDVNAEFVFVVPETFLQLKEKMNWPERKNVSFDLIPESEIKHCSGNYLRERWNKARLAAKYIKKNRVNEVFFIELVVLFPFLPLFLPKDVRVSGILYRLVPYEWKRLSAFTRVKDAIEMFVIGHSCSVKTPMCLNDNSCVCFFNKKYKTKKYISIVDPINPLVYKPISRRKDLNAKDNDKVILHFGSMTERKGTLVLLEAACTMKEELLKDKVFVFAGKVSREIKEKFDFYVEELRRKTRVVVYEGFCTYELLSDLCYSCDTIVVPYRNTSYSSGVIGYASLFHKTVIGPGDGLLGKLIKRNGLGLTLKNNSAVELAKVLELEGAYMPRPNSYSDKNTLELFTNTIIDTIMG